MMKLNGKEFAHRGYTLVEVLVGILIFAVGMMALAQLQGNLARSSGDANARTVAANVAQEMIESVRRFSVVESDGSAHAFNDIVDSSTTVSRGGYTYTVTTEVTDYYYNPADKTFSTTQPTGQVNADFKQVELTVSWDTSPQQFNIDDTQTTTGGSGSITLVDVFSSITSPSGGKVVLGATYDSFYTPPVDYNPGQRPDIISINLGNSRFKESTTPLPDVIRADELVETDFDIVTYTNPNNGNAQYLRREDMKVVSCECTLQAPNANNQGRRPSVWDGAEYSEPDQVTKPYGVSANNQQSAFCDLCCRDHHDGGTATNDQADDPGRSKFGPFLPSSAYHSSGTFAGDHKHYNRDRNGNLVLAASAGDTYVEACRLVRKDGFFRVAQDMRQEGLDAFPANYLDDVEEVNQYSTYITSAVSAYERAMGTSAQYELSPPSLMQPTDMDPAIVFPASTQDNPTVMTFIGDNDRQQLRSRGIYIDYMSDDLRTRINCLDAGGSGEDCDVPQVSSALEIIPFYEVQLTWLSRWNETPNNYPIDVSNEAISDQNSHSRGLAELTSGLGRSTIQSEVHSGNLGLTGTDPIDPYYLSDLEQYDLHAVAIELGTPPPSDGINVSGSITSSVGGVKAADVEIEATGAICDRTSLGFECVVIPDYNNPKIKVYNYFKRGKVLLACSNELAVQGEEHSGDNPDQNWTVFYLPEEVPSTTANIVIREDSC
ncbi:MAG: type IV pilus modification protein PilV [Xanthomonadales bacterium]|jgi:type IV pilus modification protein PilV|nr:type IV pilus modification protein PilV [Xanthomonadales bacterium]